MAHLLEENGLEITSKRYRSEARALDKFYTRRDTAYACVRLTVEKIGELRGKTLYLEPSVGSGAFFDALPSPKLGLDLEPAISGKNIITTDFLCWHPDRRYDNIIAIGNPPFGKNASLALRFINHAAAFATYIAFILPRTFEKASYQDKILPGLELIHQSPLSADSFLHEGSAYSVPVVFQIWQKTGRLRAPRQRMMTHSDFSFVKDPRLADFAFQRVGAAAGKVSREGLLKSPQSHYFICTHTPRTNVMNVLASIDWSHLKHCTAGNPSIGKRELIAAYCEAVA